MEEKELSQKKINLGAGNLKKSGYTNVDINSNFKPDVVADVRKLPFDDNYADEILARDVLEHIPHKETKKTLLEWKRILKKGGKLIIQTPNLQTIANYMLDSEKVDDIDYINDLIRRIYGGQNYEFNYHFAGFTPETIMNLLKSIGFKDIKVNPVKDLESKDYLFNLVAMCIK